MSIDKNWNIDHIGHVVKDLDSAVEFYTSTLGFIEECRERLDDRYVDLVFLNRGSTCIELLTALPGNTTLTKFLDSRGEGLHHICYEVDSVVVELKRLSEAGIRLIDSEPRPGARGSEIAFLHPESTKGVLVELCSY